MTIKEIAQMVGTSRGTVDRVLNGRGNVRRDLAEKIQKTAEECGYAPNPLARALVNSQKRFLVGVVINSLGNPFFKDVLEGIRHQAKLYASFGLSVIVREIRGYEQAEQLEAIHEIMDQNVDALAITPLNHPAIAEALNELRIPIVTFNTDIENVDRLAFVGCDYVNSGWLAGDLAQLILRSGMAGVVIGDRYMLGHTQRVDGFRSSLATSGTVKIAAVVENNDDDGLSYEVTRDLIRDCTPDLIYFAAAGTEGGIRAVREFRPTCRIITVDESQAIRRYLREGVVAATITQQPEEQGSRTIQILFEYLLDHKKPTRVHHFTMNQVKLRSSI